MIYIVLWISLLGEYLVYQKNSIAIRLKNFNGNESKRTMSFFLFWIIASLLMGLRSLEVGFDTFQYSFHCNNVAKLPWHEILSSWYTQSMEVGYCILIKLSYSIVNSYFFFQSVIAFILNYCVIRFIKNFSHNPYIACVVYLGMGFYLMSYNITRQMLAAAVIGIAFESIIHRNIIKYILYMLIAISIHTVSVVGFVILPIYLVKKHYKIYKVLPVFLIFIAATYKSIISYIKQNFSKYYFLAEGTEYTYGFIRIVWAIIVLMSVILFYKSIRDLRKTKRCNIDGLKQSDGKYGWIEDEWADIVVSICSVGYIVCYLIGMKIQYVERVGLCFFPFVLILFDHFGERVITSKKSRTSFYLVIIVSFLLLFSLSTRGGQYSYSTFLF